MIIWSALSGTQDGARTGTEIFILGLPMCKMTWRTHLFGLYQDCSSTSSQVTEICKIKICNLCSLLPDSVGKQIYVSGAFIATAKCAELFNNHGRVEPHPPVCIWGCQAACWAGNQRATGRLRQSSKDTVISMCSAGAVQWYQSACNQIKIMQQMISRCVDGWLALWPLGLRSQSASEYLRPQDLEKHIFCCHHVSSMNAS